MLYHVWFLTKYREETLEGEIEKIAKDAFLEVASTKKYNILEMETNKDHVHMLLEADGRKELSAMVRTFKAVSAKNIHETFGTPHLRVGDTRHNERYYRRKPVESDTIEAEKHFWARRYGWRAVRQEEIEDMRDYIRNQKKVALDTLHERYYRREPVESEKPILRVLQAALLSLALVFAFAANAYANNISVTNVSLYKAPGQPAGTIDIKFDVAWDNPYSGVDANNKPFFDRAWVFVKYWKSTWTAGTDPWAHATLISGGTLSTYNSTTNTGISADGAGAFCAIGTNQTVRWTYTAPGDTITVKVFAIEMVYIPQGPFDLGDGNGVSESTNAFHVTANTGIGLISNTTPIGTTLVSNIKVAVNGYDDDQIELTGIGIKGDGGLDTNNDGTIENALFPTGYNAFYIMKYEVSQGQYTNFLNTLTSTQANNRWATSNTGYRYAITRSGTPAVYACTNNYVACNWLSWADLCAYADWVGLRPMTELEFEKASRGGGSTAVYQDWAGGIYTAITQVTGITNPGAANETATNSGNLVYGGHASVQGPLRSGFAATSSSNRAQAGASYYGVMELSGNLWERSVTVGNSTGRAFNGANGDGSLSTAGNAYGTALQYWPGYAAGTSEVTTASAVGSGFRGGNWYSGASYVRVSDRYLAAFELANRNFDYGGRLARTSP